MKDSTIAGFPDALNYQRWWDFLDQPQLESFPLDAMTSGAAANSDITARIVGVVNHASIVTGGYTVTTANSAAVTASPDDIVIAITAAGTAVAGLTRETNFITDTPVALVVATSPVIAAGSAIKMAMTNGTNANTNATIFYTTLTLADANNYPQPGLTIVASNLGTATIADGVKGIVALSPGAADNDEIYMAAVNETHKFAAGAVFVGEALLTFTEAATNDANVIFGFTNAVAANTLVDDGAGPRVTGDYVAMWKVDGGTQWYAGVQSNGTQLPTNDTLVEPKVTAGGGTYERLKIKVVCESSTKAWAEFWRNGANVETIHFDYASATEMQLFCGVKNGGSNAETLSVDLFGFGDNRTA